MSRRVPVFGRKRMGRTNIWIDIAKHGLYYVFVESVFELMTIPHDASVISNIERKILLQIMVCPMTCRWGIASPQRLSLLSVGFWECCSGLTRTSLAKKRKWWLTGALSWSLSNWISVAYGTIVVLQNLGNSMQQHHQCLRKTWEMAASTSDPIAHGGLLSAVVDLKVGELDGSGKVMCLKLSAY